MFCLEISINILGNEAYADVSNVLTECKLMVSDPTQMDEGLLDHLCLMKQFLVGKYVNSAVKNTYFSDHDLVKLHIQRESREEINKYTDFAVS